MKTILAICHALKRFFTATKSPKTMYVYVCVHVCVCDFSRFLGWYDSTYTPTEVV